jgi:hypothetical protein
MVDYGSDLTRNSTAPRLGGEPLGTFLPACGFSMGRRFSHNLRAGGVGRSMVGDDHVGRFFRNHDCRGICVA